MRHSDSRRRPWAAIIGGVVVAAIGIVFALDVSAFRYAAGGYLAAMDTQSFARRFGARARHRSGTRADSRSRRGERIDDDGEADEEETHIGADE
ncbi:MAG: hypothetical protein ACXVAM_18215 [Vulcanimicrobiaceae bacterium]